MALGKEAVSCERGTPVCPLQWMCWKTGVRPTGLFLFTLVAGPGRSMSLKLGDTRVYELQIRARLGTAAQVAVRKLRAVPLKWMRWTTGLRPTGLCLKHASRYTRSRERIFIALMTSDRQLKASSEGSK